jgi:hypothetical protein
LLTTLEVAHIVESGAVNKRDKSSLVEKNLAIAKIKIDNLAIANYTFSQAKGDRTMNAVTEFHHDAEKIRQGWSAQRAVTARATKIMQGCGNAEALACEIDALQAIESGKETDEGWKLTAEAFATVAVRAFRCTRTLPAHCSNANEAAAEARRITGRPFTAADVFYSASSFAIAAE